MSRPHGAEHALTNGWPVERPIRVRHADAVTAPLVILATLAAGLFVIGLAYALGARVPFRLLAFAGLAIVLAAAATLATIVVRDMRAQVGSVAGDG